MRMIGDNSNPGPGDPKQKSVERYIERKRANPPKLSGSREDAVVLLARLSEAVGSVSDDFRTLLLEQIEKLLPSDTKSELFMNAAMALLHGLQPQDEMEGLLGVQLFSLHILVMQMMQRAAINGDPKWLDADINRLDKLLRAFRETLSALQRYKGKGSNQQVRVEHVHVHQGGQAVVGAVSQGGGQGGRQ